MTLTELAAAEAKAAMNSTEAAYESSDHIFLVIFCNLESSSGASFQACMIERCPEHPDTDRLHKLAMGASANDPKAWACEADPYDSAVVRVTDMGALLDPHYYRPIEILHYDEPLENRLD